MAHEQPGSQPYRGAEVREGVALPRRGMRAWIVLGVLAALLQTLVFGWMVDRGLFIAPGSGTPSVMSFVTALLGTAWMLVLLRGAIRLATGRSHTPGRLVAASVAAAFVGELYAVFNVATVDGTMRVHLREDASVAAAVFDRIAMARMSLYATSAVAFMVVAVGALGAVLTVDVNRLARANEKCAEHGSTSKRTALILLDQRDVAAAFVGLVAAVAFIVLRARGTHRDGLGGALAIVIVVVLAALGPILAARLRALHTWHDAEEARAVLRAAGFAVIAMMLAGVAIERTALANDEHQALLGLVDGNAFDVRLEHAHAFGSAWRAHPLAMIIVVLAACLPLITIDRAVRPGLLAIDLGRHGELGPLGPARSDRRDRGWGGSRGSRGDGLKALVAIGGVLVLGVYAETRQTLDPIPNVDVPRHIALPSAPGLASRRADGFRLITLGSNGELNGSDAVTHEVVSDKGSFVLAVDRSALSTHIMNVRIELGERTGWILVEGAPASAIQDLGAGARLVGPRLSLLELHMSENPFPIDAQDPMVAHTMNGVYLVLDDGDGIGRIIFRKNSESGYAYGKTRGVTFRPDLESRAKRRLLKPELERLAGPGMIVLAPHPRDDVQALVDAMIACTELAPNAAVMLTPARDAMEHAITGTIISP